MAINWLNEGLSDDRLTNNKFNKRVLLTRGDVENLAEAIINPDIWSQFFTNVDSWLSSLLFLPINIRAVDNSTGSLKVGDSVLENVSVASLPQNFYKYLGEYFVEPHFNNFADYNGYTRMQVFLPFYGLVDININEVLNKYIQFRCKLDTSTGELLYYVGVTDNSITPNSELIWAGEENVRILGTYKTVIAQQIPLGSTNTAEVKRNQILGAVSTVALTGVAVGAAIFSGGSSIPATSVLAAGGATTNAVQVGLTPQPTARLQSPNLPTQTSSGALVESTAINYPKAPSKSRGHLPTVYVNSNKLSETIQNGTNILNQRYITAYTDRPSSPVLMSNATRDVIIIFYRPRLKPIDDTYNYLYGKPLGEIRTLKNVGGYTEIGAIHLEGEGFEKATENEKSAIITNLNSGVIMPKAQLATPQINLTLDTLNISTQNSVYVDINVKIKNIVNNVTTTRTYTNIKRYENLSINLKDVINTDGVYNISCIATNIHYENSDESNLVEYVYGDYYYGQYRFNNTLTTTDLDNNIYINFTNSGVNFRGLYGDRSALGYLGADGTGIGIYIVYYNSGYQPSGGSVGWQSTSAKIINVVEPQLITDAYSKEWLKNNLVKI